MERSAEDAMAILQGAGIGAAVVENVQDLMEKDDQLKHRGYYADVWHPDPSVGTLRIDGVVPKFSEDPRRGPAAAPWLASTTSMCLARSWGSATGG